MYRFSCLLVAIAMFSTPTYAQHRSADEPFTMALTGDSIITRKLSVYDEPEYLRMIEILRGADVAFTNLEMLFHDYEPYPMAESGGTWMRADPALADDLVWAGFDMVSRANNHTGDYGVLGMQLTTKYVEQAGLVQAGVGASLAEAREAKFLETSSARVALISIASTYRKHMEAGRSRDNVPARPGLNPLRVETTWVLPDDDFQAMASLAGNLGELTNQDGQRQDPADQEPPALKAFGTRFELGDRAAKRMVANETDVAEIAAVVSNASRVADFTIVTIHAHEHAGRRETPAAFLPEFARSMVDAGADVFVGHGPHVLRGIEIYDGKPILYSLGDFIFQNETLLRLPSENYERYSLDENAHVADFNDERYDHDKKGFPANPEIWEAVIAVPTFAAGQLRDLKLYPITLGHGKPRQVRGRPLLADPALGGKILRDLQERSAPFGTKIQVRDNVGYVEPRR